MLDRESRLPWDWFAKGDQDVQAAVILLNQDGPLEIVAFHIQQAIEKYLKGYLLSTGWSLERIHDLEALVQEAIARDAEFSPFLSACQRITEYYIESRYPLGVLSELTREEIVQSLDEARELIAFTRRKIPKEE